jgi:small GTP-binding protein
MSDKTHDYVFKIVMIGDSGVDKSSVLRRFVDNKFSEDHLSTVGIDFKVKTVVIRNIIIKLQIWDTAGYERFASIPNGYFKSADAIIVAYDIASIESFDNIDNWLVGVNAQCKNIPTLLMGCNADIIDDRAIDKELGESTANKYGCKFFEVSAKTGMNIDNVFLSLTEAILEARQKKAEETTVYYGDDGSMIGIQGGKSKKTKCIIL